MNNYWDQYVNLSDNEKNNLNEMVSLPREVDRSWFDIIPELDPPQCPKFTVSPWIQPTIELKK